MAKRSGKKTRTRTKKAPKRAATRQMKRAARRPAARPAKRSAKRPTRKAARKTALKAATKTVKRKTAAPTTLRTPPSSLDMNRTPSAARSGRKSQDDNRRRHSGMSALTGGDVDADAEGAYFSGDEAPGGDNLTPDQQDVEEMGHALGVNYQDDQELQGGEEVTERDKHRWEDNPASSDDYKDRSK